MLRFRSSSALSAFVGRIGMQMSRGPIAAVALRRRSPITSWQLWDGDEIKEPKSLFNANPSMTKLPSDSADSGLSASSSTMEEGILAAPAKSSASSTSSKAKKKSKKKKVKRASHSNNVLSTRVYELSPELAALCGKDTLPRTQVIKSVWEYIKTNELQKEDAKRTIVNDEAMKKVFGAIEMDIMQVAVGVQSHILAEVPK